MFKVLGRKRREATPLSSDDSALDATNVSLSTSVPRPPVSAVRDDRVTDMLPIAKLITDWSETLCRIVSMSAGGVAAEGSANVPIGTKVALEFNSFQRVPGRVVWTRAEAIGVKFDETVDLRALLSSKPNPDGQMPRPPRLDIDAQAVIRVGTTVHKVEVRDISLGGIKVDINDPSLGGREVLVTIDSLRPVRGTVRWCRGGQAGILFHRPLAFEELTEWLGRRFELASLKAGAWTGPQRH